MKAFTGFLRRLVPAVTAGVLAIPMSVFAQSDQPAPQPTPASAQPAVAGPVRQLTVDEAVKLALEQNLNVQLERLEPQVQDFAVAQARTSWTPLFSVGAFGQTQDTPPSSFFSGAEDVITTRNAGSELAVSQLLPWGTTYSVSWDSARITTNNIFTSFNPQLQSNFSAIIEQPLLRNFRIDDARYRLLVSQNLRDQADVELRQTVALTERSVRNAYWEYKYALASLDVARQSLELAQESLRNTRSRVEIGTLAPIEIVQAEAEVARNEEGVILAEAAIGQAEDRLRALIFDPSTPEFWNMRLEPIDPVPYEVQTVDVEAAIKRALTERTDLIQTRMALERSGIDERFFRNQTLPDINLQVTYNAAGIAGTELVRDPQNPFAPPRPGGSRPFSDLLGDVFGGAFPTWRFGVNVSYPIGQSSAEAALAQTRLETRQAHLRLRNLELQIATEVRDAARQLMANAKRVEATRAARVLAERQLEAEEKKFAAGMSTSFQVFQFQRDLAEARNRELRAILDYTQSQVDFQTVQVAPISGGGSFTSALGTSVGGTTSGLGTGGSGTTGRSTGGQTGNVGGQNR
ncbi:MAG TPA: TolC family protein [Vicinamibacterales bacterium]|nr:TolC family protein [Vicinamibacterales bacterium]